jgi:hypothetical protein
MSTNIGIVGNIQHIHQNTPQVAHIHQEAISRAQFQTLIAQEIFVNKDKIVEETRPAEETHLLDPEREHHRDWDDGKKDGKQKEKKEKPKDEEHIHILDIKV